jgi:Calcineurin-like phosphoesterase
MLGRRTVPLVLVASLGIGACSPYLPPTTVPTSADPSLDPFKVALQAYLDQTQPYRKEAAQAAEKVPGKADPTPTAEASVRVRENVLANALATKLRPTAKQGDLLVPAAAAVIRRDLEQAFGGLRRDLLLDALAEQNDTGRASTSAGPPQINKRTEGPTVPPIISELLPPIPKQLEYAFQGRSLLLRDVDAQVTLDYLPDALPEPAPAGVPAVAPQPTGTTQPPLTMPSHRGATIFAMIGDSGSGDLPQEQVAKAMLAYFTAARRFPFVLMLGDNLYDDDYTGEFLTPYKPLLDRGVKFRAAIGNHDREPQIHFKPFNMNDRDYYSFDEGNARFVALNSNRPRDPDQLKFLDGAFTDAGTKWRICFFHHPLYSSGQHADESREVIRPALEPALVRNKVNVVFSGHEHLYERVAPQQGVRYFVSGGGGRKLYDFRANEFDEVGISQHHFMVAEIEGDRLLFEAITPDQKLIDCGILFRTPEAQQKPLDADTLRFLAGCELTRPRTTASSR